MMLLTLPEVVQLPDVDCQVERVQVRALGEAPVAGGEGAIETHRIAYTN